ncbi:alpha/beta fold hydrolase [Nonomuraea sp. NPDC050790]|uniref:alpha/beta fold hydrolase n=1 Tax=Nonomuraea sp. NPDC050790 TaxID=3364371 RepID=UPI0037AE2EC1
MMRETTANGLTIVYREEGQAGAPLMVLLHGRTANHNDWNGIIQHFARRYHVLAPDLRGHGESGYPGSYALPDMADDVAALLDGRRAIVVGHSLGGMVAFHLAMRHPELVERLVLEDPGAPLPMTGRPAPVHDGSTGYDWEMVLQTERQFLNPDPAWAGQLARVSAPTLVLSGGPSSQIRAEPVARLIPGARLVTIDVGHLIHTSARPAFLEAVEEFLDA